jgi:hypothetical protein
MSQNSHRVLKCGHLTKTETKYKKLQELKFLEVRLGILYHQIRKAAIRNE